MSCTIYKRLSRSNNQESHAGGWVLHHDSAPCHTTISALMTTGQEHTQTWSPAPALSTSGYSIFFFLPRLKIDHKKMHFMGFWKFNKHQKRHYKGLRNKGSRHNSGLRALYHKGTTLNRHHKIASNSNSFWPSLLQPGNFLTAPHMHLFHSYHILIPTFICSHFFE
jgi:hypothetical protein